MYQQPHKIYKINASKEGRTASSDVVVVDGQQLCMDIHTRNNAAKQTRDQIHCKQQ
jgi:hypothetical protein